MEVSAAKPDGNKPRKKLRPAAKGFEAGHVGRRLKAIPSSGIAINSQIRIYGRSVLARSRFLCVNNPYAIAAKEAYTSALAGTGIKPSCLTLNANVKKEVQVKWSDWCDEADADGLTDFYGMQGIVASEMFEAGEVFVRLRSRRLADGLTVPLQLQLLPAEMLPTDKNEALSGGRRIECGIEFNAIGKRIAYHFYRQHPGEMLGMTWKQSANSRETVRVPAEEILHLFKPIRAGQIRGIPHTLGGIVTLAMLDLYDDAELERKRIAALFGAFVTRPKAEVEDEDEPHPLGAKTNTDEETGVSDFSMEPGATIDLTEGQDVKFAEPADVGGNYEAFQLRNLLKAAAGFGVTYSDMTGDLRQTSYGSIRAGLVAFRRMIEKQQHHFMVFQFCRPIWIRWFTDAVVFRVLESVDPTAYLKAPMDFRRVKWIPPKWDWVDPLKDRQAEKVAVDNGWKARSDVIEAEGYDPEEVDARILADQERAELLGLKIGPPEAALAAEEAETLGDDEEEISEDTSEDEEAVENPSEDEPVATAEADEEEVDE